MSYRAFVAMEDAKGFCGSDFVCMLVSSDGSPPLSLFLSRLDDWMLLPTSAPTSINSQRQSPSKMQSPDPTNTRVEDAAVEAPVPLEASQQPAPFSPPNSEVKKKSAAMSLASFTAAPLEDEEAGNPDIEVAPAPYVPPPELPPQGMPHPHPHYAVSVPIAGPRDYPHPPSYHTVVMQGGQAIRSVPNPHKKPRTESTPQRVANIMAGEFAESSKLQYDVEGEEVEGSGSRLNSLMEVSSID